MIKVLKAGFYTSIQDLGRMNYQEYGVPYSGAMDSYSAPLSNALLNNDPNAAVLEVTMTGPELLINGVTSMCITGADMSPTINNVGVKNNHVIQVEKGDILSFGKLNYGFRAYIAVSGGFQSEVVMESRSMYNGITKGFRICKGDELQIVSSENSIYASNATLKINREHFKTLCIEVFKGPEFDQLSPAQQKGLFTEDFSVSKDNSRMAFQLKETFKNNLQAIITSLVMPGTVQLTPSGSLIVLMRDCQTTGGYPRVLQLKETSIDILAQKFIGSRFRFIVAN